MTRQEKRRKELRHLEREKGKLKQQGIDDAIAILQVLPVYTLMREFGFGNVRLEKFVQEFWRLTDKVKDDIPLLHTIASDIEMSTGLRFNLDGTYENLWNPNGEDKKLVRKPKK